MSILAASQIRNLAGNPILNSTGGILQVVQATQNQPISTSTASTWLDITGLSLSITPSSSTNRILLGMFLNLGVSNTNIQIELRFVRDTTAVGVGDGSSLGNINTTIADIASFSTGRISAASMMFLDSPSTTSSITYKVQWQNTTSGTMYLNRVLPSSSLYGSSISTLIAMEVAA